MPSIQSYTDLNKWQNKLLPWMIAFPSLLILIFVYLATVQLNRLNNEIANYNESELDKVFLDSVNNSLRIPDGIQKDDFVRLYVLAKMDEQLNNKRYSQGGVLLLSRLYTKYLGFFTGMVLAIVGSVFIISKLREQESTLGANSTNIKLSLVSSSPGIIFAVLGTCLMMTTIIRHNGIKINDVSTYLHPAMFIKGTEYKKTNEDKMNKAKIDSLMEVSAP